VESPNTDSSLAFAAIFEQLGTVLSRLLVREPISGSSFFILQVQDILQLIAGPSKYFRLDLATQLFQLVANLSSFSISCLITFTLMMYQFLFIGFHLFAGDISLYGLGLFLPSRYPVKVKSSISDESKPIATFTKLNSFRIRYVHIQSDDLYFIGPPPTTGPPCI